MEVHARGFEQTRSAAPFTWAASASSGGLKYVCELMKWSTKVSLRKVKNIIRAWQVERIETAGVVDVHSFELWPALDNKLTR